MCLVAQLCPTLCDYMDCSPPGSSVHADSPGKNTGVGCYVLFQGIFPTQRSNPVSHITGVFFTVWGTREAQILKWAAYAFSTDLSSSGIEPGSPALQVNSLPAKESAYQYRRHGFDSWVWKILSRRKRQLTPVFLPGKFYGQKSLAGYSPWSGKKARHSLASKQLTYYVPLNKRQFCRIMCMVCSQFYRTLLSSLKNFSYEYTLRDLYTLFHISLCELYDKSVFFFIIPHWISEKV